MAHIVATDDPMIDAELLRERLTGDVTVVEGRQDLAVVAENADALVVDVNTPVDAELLSSVPGLEIVARAGVGFENIDVAAAAERGIVVTNAPDYCTNEVATHTVALLLDCIRSIAAYDRDVQAGNWGWERTRPIHRMRGRTLGLVSFGPIARQVRERVRGFDIDVIAYDPYVDSEQMAAADVEKVSLDSLYERSDYVSLHAPLTDQTRNIVDGDALATMQDHAVLVNTGRGALIDEDALAAGLADGAIAAAGLDVLRTEPPAEEHPLIGLENCIVTPHAAWYSVEAREELNITIAENIQAALAGDTPPDYIDPETEWL
jgi:D-3-phosphoglycerate dehydrogenase